METSPNEYKDLFKSLDEHGKQLKEIITLLRGPIESPSDNGLVGTINDHNRRIGDLEKAPAKNRRDIKFIMAIVLFVVAIFKDFFLKLFK